jgi:MFS family permease
VATRELRTISTDVPSRLDRLPWSRFHWRVVIGLGTVWILDGLEVTIVGSIASRLTEPGSGVSMNSADVGTAAAVYIAGACFGALLFGQLTDRFGRKKLFIGTLGVYTLATVATAFAFTPWYFFLCRFVTGAGIGGEYSAINSAIDELIPARNRGRVDLSINGSYWVGAALGAVASLAFLNTKWFPVYQGWRLTFALGGILAFAIMIVRRRLPESPRWLIIHGHEDDAERIVQGIEEEVNAEVGTPLPEPGPSITVRQRNVIPFREIAHVAFRRYRQRAMLGLALFVGQTFLYNAVTFDLGTLLTRFFGVGSGNVPFFMVIFAVGNFLGPLALGRLFDTVGRKPMISGAYLASAMLVVLLGVLFYLQLVSTGTFILLVGLAFFVASAAASSAYLTVSEIFPMESRGLAIALFYAIGTAVGGITGPALFGQFIHGGSRGLVATGFFIGAGAMVIGGLAELFWGVAAEQRPLEYVATPLTAEAADRIEARNTRRAQREQHGAQRFRPGPGRSFYSPGMIGTAGATRHSPAAFDQRLDHEIDALERDLAKHGPASRRDLARRVGAKAWGPGRFRPALREAAHEGRAHRISRSSYGPPNRRQPTDQR